MRAVGAHPPRSLMALSSAFRLRCSASMLRTAEAVTAALSAAPTAAGPVSITVVPEPA